MDAPPPLLSAGRTTVPPTIDGTVDPIEWRFAGAATGFINIADANLAEVQTVVRVAWDADRLYVAFELPVDAEALPRTSVMERDASVWADDSVEIYLLPEGGEADALQMIGNSAGTIFDRRGADKAWDADWEFVNRVERGHWSAELAVAWSELGVEVPAGQTWRAQFARSAGVTTAWAYTVRGYNNPPLWGYLRFAENGPISQVTGIDSSQEGLVTVDGSMMMTGVDGGRMSVGADLEAFGPARERTAPSPNNTDWPERRTWTMSPGGQKMFSLPLKSGPEGRKLLAIATADAEGAVSYRQFVPLVAKEPEYVKLLAHPSERFAWVRADLRGFPQERLDLLLRAKQRDGEALFTAAHEGLASGAGRYAHQDVSDWPVGEYDCDWRIVDPESGEVLRSGQFAWERREPPQWYTRGTRLGRTDAVPTPWTPMAYAPGTVECWGRSYVLGDEPLLAQATAAGEELLAAPVRLEIDRGGETSLLTLGERLAIREREIDCKYTATCDLGGLQALVTTSAEFDGMIRYDLCILAPDPVAVEGLRLVVPVKPERAEYYNYCSSYYARGFAGTLPADGLSMAFQPFVWLGDNERGLMWFAESAGGWSYEGAPISVRRTDGATELVVELVNVPTELTDRQITFGLQATPVKPVPEDWRAWRVDRVWPKRNEMTHDERWEEQGVPINWRYLWFSDGAKPLYANLHTAPLDVMDTLGDFATQMHERGARVVPYLYLHGVSKGATDYDRYYDAWQITSPRQIGGGDRVIMGACPGSTFADYLLYGIDRWVQKYGVDGVYFDGAGPPVPCANELHGHGYVAEGGGRALEYPIFGLRDFYKRLWIALSARVEDPIIWIHADGKMATPCFSFATANWEGEMVQGPLRTGDAFLSDMLPLDFWRAHNMATQWGVVPMWLVTTDRTDDEMERRQMFDTLAVLLPHGTPIGRRGHIALDLLEKVWGSQARFGIGEATFHGYWENADLVDLTPKDPRIVASFYERDGRIMLIVSNLTEETRKVTVKLAEPVRPRGPLTDVISDESVEVDGGEFTLTVDAKSFRMLEG